MIVYKVKLIGDQNVYWLTEKNADNIIKKWESGAKDVVTIPKYGVRVRASKITEVRRVEESEPYPKEFKEQLIAESGCALPRLDSGIESIKGLPTRLVVLDSDMKLVGSDIALKKKWLEEAESVPYFYYATAHFRKGDDENEYLLSKGQVKKLVKVKFDSDYKSLFPSATIILGEWKYGIPNNVLNSKTGEEQVCYGV